MTRLVIFDIDETLLSSKHDIACFVQAFADAHGMVGFPVGMNFYVHTTDAGIATEILSRAHGRPPTPAELDAVRDQYCALLTQHFQREPGAVQQIPGAARTLNHLRTDARNRIALATGAWAASATLKLRHAGLEVDDLVRATSDDASARIDIVRVAIERARLSYACHAFDQIVLVGDGPWDLEVASALGLGFIGIGAYLREANVTWTFDDLQDFQGFASAVDSVSSRRSR